MIYTVALHLLAAAATAFVIPDEVTAHQLALDFDPPSSNVQSWWDKIPSLDDVRSSIEKELVATADRFDDYLPVNELEFESQLRDCLTPWDITTSGGHGHHGKHGRTNLTIYEVIQASNYTQKIAKLIDEYPDIVKTLNSTEANYTMFVPTDNAFEKIPEHHKKPPKEYIEKLLAYHVVPGFYPAGRILLSQTLPTLVKEEALGGNTQRLRVRAGLLGIKINFYSKVVAGNLYTANGVAHAIDSLLVPPPHSAKIIHLFPARFSTFLLAAETTKIGKELEKLKFAGSTLFLPSNLAFKKLGPRANAFLFNTEKGKGYLKALLKYHVVANETLYSDAYYGKPSAGIDENIDARPGGHYHVDLPTLLDDKNIAVDVMSWAGYTIMKVNQHTTVAVQDVVSKSGVIHVVNNVLIPPNTYKGDHVRDDLIEIDELMQRLDPYVEKSSLGGSHAEDSTDDIMEGLVGEL
ncbi:Fasciclin domain-containing protein [Pseudomassariella vexata]|uniref:Fasciclin domain-domain-containing protein n=1 Tax=Pseudomassariella vexata TaxID=1141098 RepID=A0A1Y2E7V5_9PEZI|nr:Fasciclin domain-containing protein [Pseudomassariella vexata]ORY67648.1 Fasciclin domain-domain-containing protein [Pseudomassariella vexata]